MEGGIDPRGNSVLGLKWMDGRENGPELSSVALSATVAAASPDLPFVHLKVTSAGIAGRGHYVAQQRQSLLSCG